MMPSCAYTWWLTLTALVTKPEKVSAARTPAYYEERAHKPKTIIIITSQGKNNTKHKRRFFPSLPLPQTTIMTKPNPARTPSL